jgi:hypothetical protein
MSIEDLSLDDVRDIATTLDGERTRAMIEALDLVDMSEVAKIIGVAYHRVKMLRRRSGTGEHHEPRPDELPEALPIPGGSPVYLRSEIIVWARQTGRIDADGNPVRLRPTGRPPKVDRRQRDDAGRFAR